MTLVILEDNNFGVPGDKDEVDTESQIVQLKNATLTFKHIFQSLREINFIQD